jgi:hypothetical protein
MPKPRSGTTGTKHPASGGAQATAKKSKVPGKRRKGAAASPRERVATAAAPLHDRRRRLVGARESTLRDLGGLMLEMYKRNRFREELLLDKCEEVLAIEVEIAHVDQRLFQLAPPNAAGMRPIGRCECGAPIHPGQNFCGVCGRSFATLTQSRACSKCGGGLRPGDMYCATCGNEAPDALQALEAPASGSGMPGTPPIDAAAIASSAVADTVVIEAPEFDSSTPPLTAETVADDESALLPPVVDTPPIVRPPAVLDAPPAPVADAARDLSAIELEAPAAAPIAPSPTDPTPVQPAPAAADATPAALAPSAASDLDWSAPPAAPDAAMDAAIESIPTKPTDPETPFAGFSLTSTVPPPPIVDPMDIPVPVDMPAPAAPAPSGPTAIDTTDSPQPDAPAGAPARAGEDAKAAKAAERADKKAEATAQKRRIKEAKARAKAKAKAARAQRKRGGDE